MLLKFQESTNVEFTFTGKVVITLIATKPGVTEFVVQMNDLTIERYEYKLAGTTESRSYNPSHYDSATDKWTIPFAASNTEESTLTVYYTGYMRDDMAGFYRSHYIENGAKVWMASTQFQSTSARRAFPCFDVRQKIYFFNVKLNFCLSGTRTESILPTDNHQTGKHGGDSEYQNFQFHCRR